MKEVKRSQPAAEDMALITATIPRERIVLAQTPQAFSYALLRDAFARRRRDGVVGSDESALVERSGHDVFVVLGSERNLKITRPADMDLARFYLEQERKDAGPKRKYDASAAIGYDLHRLAEGRKLMIGGIQVPFDKGPVGHSDGDVLATRCATRCWAPRAWATSARISPTPIRSGKAQTASCSSSTRENCSTSGNCASIISMLS